MSSEQKKNQKPKADSGIKIRSPFTAHPSLIGFWGYPDPELILRLKIEFPYAHWVDLDVDFKYPETNILPDAYCKIIKNVINNAIFLKDKFIKIIATVGKDKCDSGWFAAQLLKDMGFDIIESSYEKLLPKKEIKICTSNLPLYDKVNLIMNGIIEKELKGRKVERSKGLTFKSNHSTIQPFNRSTAKFGFWGVPPNDLEILKLFPAETHVFGWTRCVEAGTPADIELEIYVDENLPTVFYSQAFCAKSQLAKYLADKYNGLYIDIDDYATNSIKAKIEAFLRLR